MAKSIWTIVELVAIVGLIAYTAVQWTAYQVPPDKKQQLLGSDERTLAMEAVTGAIGVGLTGTSIILGLIGAIAGLGRDLPPTAKAHFRWGAGYAVLSLVFGVFNMGSIPAAASAINLAFDFQASILVTVQTWLMVAAAWRMFFGINATLAHR